ncbi:MAG: UDP-N-acetylmuramoyl-tripeptide--D-alanyl-D-alanine ligase [Peptostreptococcaceae bacterium]|nr:UDP-N-acetylmuramoyl-tripeptide--D-alanyl-D-alanine ligase [Peptostreptococcaceae bacterium]
MKTLTLEQINHAVKGTLICQATELLIKGVSTDSRTVKAGELFIPLIGEHLDAHKFIPQAIANGCSAVLVNRSYYEKNALSQNPSQKADASVEIPFIECEDTTKGLQDLARYYLSTFNMKKVGITGSTGKTTTKEMVYSICSEKYKTERNLGNFNNHIGLPLTVLSFAEDTQVGILEMGMSKKDEINLLAEIVRPDIGVITNIGTAHIENLKNRKGVLDAKMEITNYFGKENVLIVNRDNDLPDIEKLDVEYKLVTVGENGRSDMVISNITDLGENGITFTMEHRIGNEYESQTFKLNIPGRHNAYNSALAVAVGLELGVSLEEAARGLEKMENTDKRLSIKGKDGIKIIDDTYNASVDSMKSGIDVLESVFGMRKIAILADMLEMGEKSAEYHEEVGEYLTDKNLDMLITVGEASKHIEKAFSDKMPGIQTIHFKNQEDLNKKVREIVKPGDVILIKGSRGMKMDEVVKCLLGE